MLAVNVGGCIAWCNAAAQLFQTQRAGTIVGISSIAGDRGRKGNPVYCTTQGGDEHLPRGAAQPPGGVRRARVHDQARLRRHAR